ncbi:MAG: hypothetical protein FP831_11225 [Anaerolineae bacterium]|nr:hypothetical protein [Anaerolineae bacterium]
MIQNLNLIIRSLLAKFFRRITHREYHFQTISNCSLNKWEIDFEQQKERIKNHLSEVNKGISPNVKPHIFIACHHVNWEFNNLVEPWFELGEVEHYDWGENFNQYAPDWNIKKRQFCNELLEHIKTAHQKHPIDIFFSYLSGNWIYADVISEISKLGIITINISFDDTLKFWDQLTETGFTGNADIAPFFDICITCQNSAAVAKYIYV